LIPTLCARRRLLQRSKYLYGGSASIHRELRALDEARSVCREEDNGFGNLIGGGGTPGWCLSG
jgi:hypothetical protein